jgi:signal transduction histidine kinase
VVAAALFALVTFGFNAHIGATTAAALAYLTANLVQVTAATACLRRWLPGTASPLSAEAGCALSTVRGVLGLSAAAAVAALAGAGVGVTWWALWVPSVPTTWLSVLLWWGRNTVGIIGVVSTVVLVAAAWRQHRSGTADPILTNRSVLDSLDAALARSSGLDEARPAVDPHAARHRVMVALLFATTAAAYTLDLSQWGGPTAFPLLAFTIWSGLLCSALVTVLHTLMSTALLVFWTIQDRGPFSLVESPRALAVEVQLYVAFILVLGLLLAAARSEIRAGLGRVLAVEEGSAARAGLLSAVAEAISDGVIVVDATSTIVNANRAALELLGLDLETTTRCSDLVLLRPDGGRVPAEDYPSTRARREGTSGPEDLVVIHPDGSPRTFSVRATRLDDAHGRYRRSPGSAPVAVVFADVTEERAQHDYLAGFAGMVAHDLRSPLTTVRGWLDMCQVMLESDPHTPAGDLGEPLSRATAGAVQMGRLIDDLMTHVSAHGQVLELEPVDLVALVRDVAEAHGVGESLTSGAVPPVWADRALVHQLVTNLVGNAAKYRHPERALALTLHGEERHGLVTLVLEDNGRGIPAADADKVFERFYRVEEHRDAGTGTGLGLAMCRTIVERHGGTIRVLPRPVGAGAALEVILAAVPLPVTARPVHGPDPLDALGPQRRHLRTVTD